MVKGRSTDLSLHKRLTQLACDNYYLYSVGSKIRKQWKAKRDKHFKLYQGLGGKVLLSTFMNKAKKGKPVLRKRR